MRKTFREQIEGKCVHFNGLINKTCEAGINYDSVSGEKRYDLPCIKDRNKNIECSECRFPTKEEVDKRVEESNKHVEKVMKGIRLKKTISEKHGENYGTGALECPECGGNLHYRYYGHENGHLHMKCETENCIGFME